MRINAKISGVVLIVQLDKNKELSKIIIMKKYTRIAGFNTKMDKQYCVSIGFLDYNYRVEGNESTITLYRGFDEVGRCNLNDCEFPKTIKFVLI